MNKIEFSAMMNNIVATGDRFTLLMGAGCSVTGNIPLANKIVQDIKANPSLFQGLAKSDSNEYFELMESLNPAIRRQLFNDYIEASNVNVSNFIAAQLLASGKIKSILTTNFDNLLVQSGALINNSQPIYDVTLSGAVSDFSIYFPSIIYLHGQMHGFWQLNTGDELQSHKPTIRKFLRQAMEGMPLIIVGYSGNDHIVDLLAENTEFIKNLYWVTYNDSPVESPVETLLSSKPGCFQVDGNFDADLFFLKVAEHYSILERYSSQYFKFALKGFSQMNSIVNHGAISVDILNDLKNKIGRLTDVFEDPAIGIFRGDISDDSIALSKHEVIDLTQFIDQISKFLLSDEVIDLKSSNPLVYITFADTLSQYYRLLARKLISQEYFQKTIDLSIKILEMPPHLLNPRDKFLFNIKIAISFCEMGKPYNDENSFVQSWPYYEEAANAAFELSDLRMAFDCWGISHQDYAVARYFKGIIDEKTIFHFEMALEKLRQALQYEKSDKVYNNLSSVLIDMNYILETDTIEEAIKNALKAEELAEGRGAYNLTCCYSIKKDYENAFRYLELALSRRAHRKQEILSEEHFFPLHDEPKFIELMNTYYVG